jgi:mRNA-degrading endonuclease RelE of RelBE toxin-antitoxin system
MAQGSRRRLLVDPSVRDFLRTLAPSPRRDLRAALRQIAEDPYHEDLDVKVLRSHGPDRLLRVRVRQYRIVYVLRGQTTAVLRALHRSEGYGWLERAG